MTSGGHEQAADSASTRRAGERSGEVQREGTAMREGCSASSAGRGRGGFRGSEARGSQTAQVEAASGDDSGWNSAPLRLKGRAVRIAVGSGPTAAAAVEGRECGGCSVLA